MICQVHGRTQGRTRQKSLPRRYPVLSLEGHLHSSRFSRESAPWTEAEVDLQVDGLGRRRRGQGPRGPEQNMLCHVRRREERPEDYAVSGEEEGNCRDHSDAGQRRPGRHSEVLLAAEFSQISQAKEVKEGAYSRDERGADADVQSREASILDA